MRAQGDSHGRFDKNATFGQRRSTTTTASGAKGKGKMMTDFEGVKFAPDGGVEMTYIPSASAAADEEESSRRAAGRKQPKRKGVETFGAGLEKGREEPELALSESERKGRTQRRKGMRSGSKNTFRRM